MKRNVMPPCVMSGHSAMRRICPLYPRNRTLAGPNEMSAKCQKRTSAKSHFLILERIRATRTNRRSDLRNDTFYTSTGWTGRRQAKIISIDTDRGLTDRLPEEAARDGHPQRAWSSRRAHF